MQEHSNPIIEEVNMTEEDAKSLRRSSILNIFYWPVGMFIFIFLLVWFISAILNDRPFWICQSQLCHPCRSYRATFEAQYVGRNCAIILVSFAGAIVLTSG